MSATVFSHSTRTLLDRDTSHSHDNEDYTSRSSSPNLDDAPATSVNRKSIVEVVIPLRKTSEHAQGVSTTDMSPTASRQTVVRDARHITPDNTTPITWRTASREESAQRDAPPATLIKQEDSEEQTLVNDEVILGLHSPGNRPKKEEEELLSDQQLRSRAARLHEPVAKRLKEMQFNDDFVAQRLGLAESYPIDLDEGILNSTVKREFISVKYGGSAMDTFPRLSKDNVKAHGFDDWMMITTDFNPHAPLSPGHPGLFFTASEPETEYETLFSVPKRVFVRLQAGRWLYMGAYKIVLTRPMAAQDFLVQSDKVRRTWGEKILSTNWGAKVRTQIYLRRELGMEPIPEDVVAALGDKAVQAVVRRNTTWQEIVQAYDAGEEEISVWRMVCVGYDVEFKRRLVDDFRTFVPKRPSASEGPKSRKWVATTR